VDAGEPFASVNDRYEEWLRKQCDVDEPDLARKHEKMRENAFVFLRATYFRWAGTVEQACPDLASAPPVLAVADAHLENFGTWRDADQRLVWGVNDFDEASVMPYPFDLVRLAASIRLAPDVDISNRKAAGRLLEGYARGLEKRRPTLLDDHALWMRPLVACRNRDRGAFWSKLDALETIATPPSAGALGAQMPDGAEVRRFAKRTAGAGSLGRPRCVAIADWRGGRAVREAKALVPSAWDWAHDRDGAIRFLELAQGANRAPDPFLCIHDRFVIRRLAADSRKVELDARLAARLSGKVVEAMGFDLGSIHAVDDEVEHAVRSDLERRPSDWLFRAAKTMARLVLRDFDAWSRVSPAPAERGDSRTR
jgi:hypothetical protein